MMEAATTTRLIAMALLLAFGIEERKRASGQAR